MAEELWYKLSLKANKSRSEYPWKVPGDLSPDIEELRLKDEKALQTAFFGITFSNPFCLSSSPVSNTADMCIRA